MKKSKVGRIGLKIEDPPVGASPYELKKEASFHKDTLKNDELLMWGHPHVVSNEICTYDLWVSLCGRYKIARHYPSSEERYNLLYLKESGWDFMYYDPNKTGRPKDFYSLREALSAVKKFHRDRKEPEELKTNEETILDLAKGDNLHNLPSRIVKEVKEPKLKKEKKHKGSPPLKKKVGKTVQRMIQEVLMNADEENPISEKEILKILKKKFPKKLPGFLSKTLGQRLSTASKNKKGYWI